ncbi:cation-transporting P-type ATPase [Candidatus Peregrinibacteria bacterium]|nr:cation-transporting P-type ATPase [Candidatus Peregrinibacteria bacterium]
MAEKTLAIGGLTSQEALRRLEQFGPNVIKEKRKTPLIIQFLSQFKDVLVIILIAAAIFAYVAGEKVDGSVIIGIVILNATIGFFQGYKAEKAIEALKKLLSPKARVARDGMEILIDAKDLVPGDIVILNEGDKVSADCKIEREYELRADESILTGESMPVKKDAEQTNKLFMGTQITHGNCIAVVAQTGMRTEFGRIAQLTSETKKDKSPLQKELAHIGVFVGKITIAISGVLFLIGIFVQGRGIVDTLLFAVSVAVAAVPEGLPATITVALALGVQRLARENAIVKQLSSVETLGSTTVICSDKTGTLTKNEMTVQDIFFDTYEISVRGVGYEPTGAFAIQNRAGKEVDYFDYEKEGLGDLASKRPAFYRYFELINRSAIICNNARLANTDDRWHILGDPTEGALVTMAEKAGFMSGHVNSTHKRIFESPFDSARKRMSVIAQEADTKKVFAYVKGAPDAMLSICSRVLENGQIIPFDAKKKEAFLKKTDSMANRALRTIAFAYKEISTTEQRNYNEQEIENNLIFIGLVGMMDPPRDEVKEAVKLTHRAGIRVFIITGDHGLTAHAVAKELGIAKSYGVNIVTGEMLNKMPDNKLDKLVAPGQETIFARVSPEHKLRVVESLKRLGETVAVTGDGVNDAPALKRADIGVAMGITGTDVSKEAANMVLTDDSFGTIVTAVIEGRTIYENMKKFIYYIFSANIGELLCIFITIMLGLPAPLTAVLILIVNTLTDVFPSLALGVEPVERNILEKAPRKPDAKIMEGPFIRRYVTVGFLIGTVTAGTFLWNLYINGWWFGEKVELDSAVYAESATMAFVVLTLIQMVHSFMCRSESVSCFRMNPFKNMYLVAAVASSTLFTIAAVEVPFLQKFLKTTSLTSQQWGVLVAFSFSILVFEEIRKFFLRKKLQKTAALSHA